MVFVVLGYFEGKVFVELELRLKANDEFAFRVGGKTITFEIEKIIAYWDEEKSILWDFQVMSIGAI